MGEEVLGRKRLRTSLGLAPAAPRANRFRLRGRGPSSSHSSLSDDSNEYPLCLSGEERGSSGDVERDVGGGSHGGVGGGAYGAHDFFRLVWRPLEPLVLHDSRGEPARKPSG